ncbi:MAG: hypothetical protein ACXVBO_22860, partial [Isosphaeraceae bacterium]
MFIAFSLVRSHNSMTGAMDAPVQKTAIEVEKRTSQTSSPLPGWIGTDTPTAKPAQGPMEGGEKAIL